MKAFVIDWLDHYVHPAETAWTTVADMVSEPVGVRTVGYVIKRSKDIITVAHTLHEGEAIGVFHILRKNITSMVPLELPAAVKKAARKAKVKKDEHQAVPDQSKTDG